MDQNNKKSLPPVLSRILTVVAIIVVFVLARLLLGSQEMMYLSAKDIDHIDVAVNPDGIVLTSTGDDSAAAVKILNKTICYYPRQEEAATISTSTARDTRPACPMGKSWSNGPKPWPKNREFSRNRTPDFRQRGCPDTGPDAPCP